MNAFYESKPGYVLFTYVFYIHLIYICQTSYYATCQPSKIDTLPSYFMNMKIGITKCQIT